MMRNPICVLGLLGSKPSYFSLKLSSKEITAFSAFAISKFIPARDNPITKVIAPYGFGDTEELQCTETNKSASKSLAILALSLKGIKTSVLRVYFILKSG